MSLTPKEILQQSQTTLKQWGPLWEGNCIENAPLIKADGTSHKDLFMQGTGRVCVVCATGFSLEKSMDILAKYKGKVDFACNDKSMKHLLEAGITPTWVVVADGKVSYEEYCAPWIEKTKDINLVINATANPKWAKNWQGKRYWYVNKDNIKSEVKLADLSGCHEAIPASSNVGNTVVVFLCQLLNYDKLLLVGYDYCWRPEGNYYAYSWSPVKRAYMHHMDMLDHNGRIVFTSQNLRFSCRWLEDFTNGVRLGECITNCSDGILSLPYHDLETQLRLAADFRPRKWIQQEKEQYLNEFRQHVVLGLNQMDQLKGLMEQPGMVTLNVAVSGVPKHIAEIAESK